MTRRIRDWRRQRSGVKHRFANPDPRTVDHLRTILALNSLGRLIVYFVLLLIGIAALIGGIYWQTESPFAPHHTYWYWWRESVLALGGLSGTSIDNTANSAIRATIQTVTARTQPVLATPGYP